MHTILKLVRGVQNVYPLPKISRQKSGLAKRTQLHWQEFQIPRSDYYCYSAGNLYQASHRGIFDQQCHERRGQSASSKRHPKIGSRPQTFSEPIDQAEDIRFKRIFLDANILFSAAREPGSGFKALWTKKDIILFTSRYAITEAHKNLPTPKAHARLQRLIAKMQIVSEGSKSIPSMINLPPKDRPILQAALNCNADFLLTGDGRHFGKYFGKCIQKTRIMTPGKFIKM